MKRFLIYYYIIKNIFICKFKGVEFKNNLRIVGSFKIVKHKTARICFGSNYNLVSGLMLNSLGRNIKSMIRADENAKIVIGDNVGMSCVSIWAKNEIHIRNNVKLGSGVIVMDSDMHSLNYQLRRNPNTDASNATTKKVVIGNDAFIGVNTIITKGVLIGDRSIVAAGSVVVKSIPKDEIWGGNPAVFIKKIN